MIVRADWEGEDQTAIVSFFNGLGEIVAQHKISNHDLKQISLADLSAGLYFVNVQCGEFKTIKKLIVSKGFR